MFVPSSQRVMRRRGWQRTGIAVVLVLGLLAVTLAVSYATLRGQGTTAQLAANNSRALDASEAARSGLAAALRKISDTGWAGVDVPLSANVTPNSWYEVTFTTGDAKLAPADADYGEYAFRLTINSTGYAADPTNAAIRSIHKSRCVTQLVRTAVLAEPANWATLTNHTVYQWAIRNIYTQFPVRVNGSAVLHGRLYLSTEYPGVAAPRDRYLEDLKTMQVPVVLLGGGRPDYRPFNSPLTIALARQDAATLTLLQSKLGLTTNDSTAATTVPLAHPGNVLSYRLYPGGKQYSPTVIQTTYGNPIQDLTLGPDPVNNPLGIFRSTGPLTVQNNVRITGTLISDGAGPEILLTGTNVVLQAANLPALYGSSQVRQLPAILSRDDLEIHSAADVKLRGFTMVWDEFDMKTGDAATKLDFQGQLVTAGLLLKGRSNWVLNATQWNNYLTAFNGQSLLDLNRLQYFPEYMQREASFTVQPALTLSPDSSGVQPHWHDWTQPVYQQDPDDPGLRWEVIRWEAAL